MELTQVSESLNFNGNSVHALVKALEPILREHGYTINKLIGETEAYTVANLTENRTFDADTVVIGDLADVVGSLIADLQAKGVLG